MRHTQYFTDLNPAITRRLFVTKTERRIAAAWDFLRMLACLCVFAFIGILLAWRG